jgi:hypothetical protein
MEERYPIKSIVYDFTPEQVAKSPPYESRLEDMFSSMSPSAFPNVNFGFKKSH